MEKIIQNAVKITEDGKTTYLISHHTHNFVSYAFKDNDEVFVDGGKDYLRRGCSPSKHNAFEEFSLSEESSQDEIIKKFLWKFEKQDYKPLIECSIKELEKLLIIYQSYLECGGLSNLRIFNAIKFRRNQLITNTLDFCMDLAATEDRELCKFKNKPCAGESGLVHHLKDLKKQLIHD